MLQRMWFGLIILIELLAAPAGAQPQLPTSADDVVVLAKDLVVLGPNAQQESGQIVVNEAGGIAIVSYSFTTLADLAPQLIADALRLRGLGTGAKIFDLFANSIEDRRNALDILDAGPLPISTFPILAFPTPVSTIPGDLDLTLKRGDILTIAAGRYGKIRLQSGSQLFFEGGTYDVRLLRLGKNARVRFNGPTTLNIAERFRVGTRSSFIPSVSTTPLNARCIAVNVASRTPVRLGARSEVTAAIAAPAATMKLGRSGIYRGSFTASKVIVGPSAALQVESPLTSPCL